MPDERLWDTFEEARVFALPSRASVGRIPGGEGFGIVYAEAAAFGRPVVGSNAAGAAEAVADGVSGRTVEPTNVDAVASALIEFLRDPNHAERCGDAGRARVLEGLVPAVFARNLLSILASRGVP
jgi:phosphatidylinositol alpha-1,6-mannosyltransferase